MHFRMGDTQAEDVVIAQLRKLEATRLMSGCIAQHSQDGLGGLALRAWRALCALIDHAASLRASRNSR